MFTRALKCINILDILITQFDICQHNSKKSKLTFVYLQGTDQSMLNKLHNQHGKNKNYLKPKSEMNMSFGLNHFAGVVFYDAKSMYYVGHVFVLFVE